MTATTGMLTVEALSAMVQDNLIDTGLDSALIIVLPERRYEHAIYHALHVVIAAIAVA